MSNIDREFLGRVVREEWIAWAKEQPDPKPSWLASWEELDDPSREVDRRIGEKIASLAVVDASNFRERFEQLRADLAAMEQRAALAESERNEARSDADRLADDLNKMAMDRDSRLDQIEALTRRATRAESERDELRGEAVLLREALTKIHDTLNPIPRHDNDPLEVLVKTARTALTATPTSAALGALIEAALKRHEADAKMLRLGKERHVDREALNQAMEDTVEALDVEDAAADAVLAVMGKEGA